MQVMIDPQKFVPQLLSFRISFVRFALLKKIETIHSISVEERSSETFPMSQKFQNFINFSKNRKLYPVILDFLIINTSKLNPAIFPSAKTLGK